MASNSKKSKAGDSVQKCGVPSHKSVNCQCTDVQILSTVNLPSTSRAAAVDRAINSQKDILGDEIFIYPAPREPTKPWQK